MKPGQNHISHYIRHSSKIHRVCAVLLGIDTAGMTSYMKTSWHENTFRFTGPLSVESTGSPYKGIGMRSLGVFFDVSLNKSLNKQTSYRWFERIWRSCQDTMIHTYFSTQTWGSPLCSPPTAQWQRPNPLGRSWSASPAHPFVYLP